MNFKLRETTKDKLFYALLGFGLMANVWPAEAGLNTNATVERHYKTVAQQIPHTETRCQDEYVQGNNNEVLGLDVEGAIIGGIIGNQIGDMKGNGAAGALLGGLLGKQNKPQGGYRHVCRDITTYTSEYREQYSHSTITFTDQNGQVRTLRFYE